jgi:hypothetical protein
MPKKGPDELGIRLERVVVTGEKAITASRIVARDDFYPHCRL